MPENDLRLLHEAAQAAGEIAARHFGQGVRRWEKGGGQGPVTEADLEIDAMLRKRLLAARPRYGWLSEETADSPARLDCASVFVVDPIDGTRAFIDGQKSFAHALAVVRDGQPVAAVVHLPLMDLTYGAALGGGAWLNGRRLAVPLRRGLEGARVLAARPMLAPELWPGGVPPVERHFRPSLAWRLALVAEGAFDAMLTLRKTWDWDIAAAALIAREAGAVVSDRHGAVPVFAGLDPRNDGIVAAGPGVHADLMGRLGPPAVA
ncbi:3'(2'),5'-bisphosphate nucleotidase CysQ [Rhodobacteraceae bacterium 2376]|uniref:3'(2'),5'-bisphosphate nucleotidase CysQ n=1 Tax=Rhabdonatronobacter sediminivivens TaxID=2743469 RepID=A0A7Z0HX58_9RHOB|nr:3'(2'),5'-bisphosphate nucleotidase CysQ [Rhabdonatronobacter sediminivivens]NYS23928.1 3'(2'),5'-bisphosphate nucleotidase CysQ [Rhabdonatronobacter sediminivivens]